MSGKVEDAQHAMEEIVLCDEAANPEALSELS